MKQVLMNLPRITPTPLSGWLWTLWAILILVIVAVIVFWMYRRWKENKGLSGASLLLAIVILIGVAFPISSKIANYANSSSYVKKEKEQELEYNNNQQRKIQLLDYNGKKKYEYTGTFSFELDNNKRVNLTDNKTGDKITVIKADNDSIIISDIAK